MTLAGPKGAPPTGSSRRRSPPPPTRRSTIEFNNQDPGVQHNVVISSEDPAKDPTSETFFDGELTTGPRTTTYEVRAAARGLEYFFFCEVHPTTMNGDHDGRRGAAPGTGASGK